MEAPPRATEALANVCTDPSSMSIRLSLPMIWYGPSRVPEAKFIEEGRIIASIEAGLADQSFEGARALGIVEHICKPTDGFADTAKIHSRSIQEE